MTKNEILQLVKEHFQEGGVRDDGSCSAYYGDTDTFVRFAEKIYQEGYRDGCAEGYLEGYDEGAADYDR